MSGRQERGDIGPGDRRLEYRRKEDAERVDVRRRMESLERVAIRLREDYEDLADRLADLGAGQAAIRETADSLSDRVARNSRLVDECGVDGMSREERAFLPESVRDSMKHRRNAKATKDRTALILGVIAASSFVVSPLMAEVFRRLLGGG